MKPRESLVSLATAVVVAGDGMESQGWCTLRLVVAAHSHIARFAAAYPCLNRGADFRSLAKRLANGPRFALDGFAMRVVNGGTCAAAAGRRRTPGCPINRELSPPIEHAVDLARHDEIVLVQSLDRFGAQRHGRVTPAEAHIGVMAFGLGKLADSLHEGERLLEIAEAKRALDAMGVIAQLPIRSLLLET